MNVRKTVKKILALSGGALMVGATVMGAMAYDLADYPAPFIQDGVFDGSIIVGASASTQDVLGAIDIAASLQAMAVSKEPVDIPGVAGEVNLEGDTFRIGTSSDNFELREPVGDVYDTFDEADLDALSGGTITTDEGTTDYNQYLRLEVLNSTGNNQLVDWGVNYVENEDNEMGDFMTIVHDSSKGFFEWEVEFTDGLESSVGNNNDLEDIENEDLNIFGTDFSIVDTKIEANTARGVTLDFMAGDVSSTLREGETKTFTIDGVEYEVTLMFVSDPNSGGDPEAKFMVNGEVTRSLKDGETDTLSGGLQIGVRDLLVNGREGVVEFFLGADKIELQDTNTTDDGFYQGVEVSNEKIEDALVMIKTGIVSDSDGDGIMDEGDVVEITSIKYRLKADALSKQDLYIPPGHGVREYLDEPQGMLSPSFDIRYEGLTEPDKKEVRLNARSDNQYYLEFTNIRGDTYEFPFFSVRDDGVVQFGDDDDTDNNDFVFIEGGATYNIGLDDYFVVTNKDGSTFTKKSVTNVLQFQDLDTSEHRVTFEDLAGGTKEATYDATSKEGTLNIGGHTYKFKVDETNNALTVDMNADGTYTANDQIDMVVFGGAVLSLVDPMYEVSNTSATYAFSSSVGDGQTVVDVDNVGDPTTGVQLDMSLSFESSLYDEPTNPEVINWSVDAYKSGSNYYVDLNINQNDVSVLYGGNKEYNKFQLKEPDNVDDHKYGMITYGAFIDHYNPTGSNDPDELTISIPEEQVFPQVFIVAGTVQRAESAGGVTTEVVNPISVGAAVLDTDAPALGTANMIVVGGPCANTVAAEIMGNPANCAEGFTPGKALIKSVEQNGKVAILVAGYEAQETRGASYVLANYKDYSAFQGSEVEVVVPDLSNIVVQAVTNEPAAEDTTEMSGNETGQ